MVTNPGLRLPLIRSWIEHKGRGTSLPLVHGVNNYYLLLLPPRIVPPGGGRSITLPPLRWWVVLHWGECGSPFNQSVKTHNHLSSSVVPDRDSDHINLHWSGPWNQNLAIDDIFGRQSFSHIWVLWSWPWSKMTSKLNPMPCLSKS